MANNSQRGPRYAILVAQPPAEYFPSHHLLGQIHPGAVQIDFRPWAVGVEAALMTNDPQLQVAPILTPVGPHGDHDPTNPQHVSMSHGSGTI